MANANLYFKFLTSDSPPVGATGLTVTCNVYEVTRAGGAITQIVTAGSCTEIGNGLYVYNLSSPNFVTYDYVATAIPSSSSGLTNGDADSLQGDLSFPSLKPATIGNTLTVDGSGNGNANIVNIKGTASAGAAGYVGIDLAQVDNPTSTLALTGTTVKLVAGSFVTATLGTVLMPSNVTQFGGTAVTGRDIGESVLISSGTGTGQLAITSGAVLLQPTQPGISFTGGLIISNSGGTALTITSTGANGSGISATGNNAGAGFLAVGGTNGIGFSIVGGSGASCALELDAPGGTGLLVTGDGSSHDITLAGDGKIGGSLTGSVNSVVGQVNANLAQVDGQTANAAGAVTFPGTIASPTNITAGTITTVTNLTNAATVGDFTSTMKASIAGSAWNALTSSYTVSGSFGAALGSGGGGGPTAAQIATAVWQDTAAGDFTVSGSIGLSLFTGHAPGASSGVALVGSTMALTTGAIDAIDTELSASHGSGEWGSSSGSGAFTVTVTVTDTSSAAVPGANVRISSGVTSLVATTNGSGVATFAVDAATWAIAITKSGYTFTPSTIVVTADANFAETLTPVVIPSPPSGSPVCNVYGFFEVLTGGLAAPNPTFGTPNPIPITFALSVPSGTSGSILVIQTIIGQILNGVLVQPGTSNQFLPLVRNDSITPANTTYMVTCPAIGLSNTPITLAAPTYDLSGVVPP